MEENKLVLKIFDKLNNGDWIELNMRDRDRLFKVDRVIKNSILLDSEKIERIITILNESWADYNEYFNKI